MELFHGLGHIAIYTKDIEQSIAFYTKLGGTVLDRCEKPGKRLALVDFGGVTLELLQFEDGMAEQEGVISHFAIAVDDVDATAAALEALGVDTFETPATVRMPDAFGGLDNRFFRGPDGERVELLKMYH